jgi:hypothetical protein
LFFCAKAQNGSKITHQIDTKLTIDAVEADMIDEPS